MTHPLLIEDAPKDVLKRCLLFNNGVWGFGVWSASNEEWELNCGENVKPTHWLPCPPDPNSPPVIRRFRSLPLGTRYRRVDCITVWIILEHHGCGLVAIWSGIDGPVDGQEVWSFAESESECEAAEVWVVE